MDKRLLDNEILREANLTPPNKHTNKLYKHYTYKIKPTKNISQHQPNTKSKELKKLFKNWLNSQE